MKKKDIQIKARQGNLIYEVISKSKTSSEFKKLYFNDFYDEKIGLDFSDVSIKRIGNEFGYEISGEIKVNLVNNVNQEKLVQYLDNNPLSDSYLKYLKDNIFMLLISENIPLDYSSLNFEEKLKYSINQKFIKKIDKENEEILGYSFNSYKCYQELMKKVNEWLNSDKDAIQLGLVKDEDLILFPQYHDKNLLEVEKIIAEYQYGGYLVNTFFENTLYKEKLKDIEKKSTQTDEVVELSLQEKKNEETHTDIKLENNIKDNKNKEVKESNNIFLNILVIIGKVLAFPFIFLFKGIGKIVTSEPFKKASKVVVVLVLVCSILFGVGYGLFALGKLVVNGIGSLVNNISFRSENTCYYDNGIVVEESTCTKEGTILYVCQRHGEEKKEKIPVKHNFMKHCECVDCGLKLENEQYIQKIKNGFHYQLGTIKTSTNGEKYISADYTKYLRSPVKNDIIIPSHLETEDGEFLPVREVILQYYREYEEVLNGDYVDITIYGHQDTPIDIYVGNFEIENLTIFGNVGILSSYDNDYVEAELKIKNINIYGDLEELVYNPITRTNTNKIRELEQKNRTKNYNKRLKSFTVTGDIKNLDTRFFFGSKIKQINITKNTKTINLPELDQIPYLKKLFNIYVNENNQYYSCYDGVLFSKDKKQLLLYPIARKANYFIVPDGVEDLGNLYQDYNNLKKVVIPTSVEWFYGRYPDNCVVNLRKVYFKGSEELFYEKFPGGLTQDKTYTKIYFYSEEKINDGKHWHFNKFNNPKRW